jgi:hypothetical protein
LNGDLDAAEPLYQQCVAQARELGDSEVVAVGLLNLAMVAMARGRAERARNCLLEVVALAAETGSRITIQSALEAAAGLAAVRGEWEHAARFFGAADAQTAFTGAQRDPADEAFLQPLIAAARQALGEQRFRLVQASGGTLLSQDAVADARAWLSTA